MKSTLLSLLGTAFLAGCALSGQSYISKHPELTPEQRKIIKTGDIPNGAAVAGLSKDAIRVAMRSDPSQFTTVDGVEAWVFVKEKDTGDFAPDSSAFGPDYTPGEQHTSTLLSGPEEKVQEHITILFKNDRAIRAEVSREKVTPEPDPLQGPQ